MNKHKLILTTFNVNGAKSRKPELIHHLTTHKTDVLLLQETRLKNRDTFKLPNYAIYRQDRPEGRGGGVAIAVKRTIKHTPIINTTTSRLEHVTIIIPTGKTKIAITSVYNPPTNRIDTQEIRNILEQESRAILAGDLNSKHTEWGCRTTNNNGSKLHKMLERNRQYKIGTQDEITRDNVNGGDILDYAIYKNLRINNIRRKTDLQSDHIAVEMEIIINQSLEPPTKPKHTYNYTKFSIKMEEATQDIQDIKTNDEIDIEIHKLINKTKQALEQAKVPQKTQIQETPRVLPTEILNKIREKIEPQKNIIEQDILHSKLRSTTW